MLLPLIENDYVLAKALPKCAVPNNTTISVPIPNSNMVDVLYAMLLTVSLRSLQIGHTRDWRKFDLFFPRT
jgi:hypothetical protein